MGSDIGHSGILRLLMIVETKAFKTFAVLVSVLMILSFSLFIVCKMTQCILLKVQCFYFWRSKGPLGFLSTRDKRIAIKFQENQRLSIGNQNHKDAT